MKIEISGTAVVIRRKLRVRLFSVLARACVYVELTPRQLLDRALVHGLVTKYTTTDLFSAAERQVAMARLMHMADEGRGGATHYCQLYALIPSPDHRAAPAPAPEPAIAEPAPPAAAAAAAAAEVDAKVE